MPYFVLKEYLFTSSLFIIITGSIKKATPIIEVALTIWPCHISIA